MTLPAKMAAIRDALRQAHEGPGAEASRERVKRDRLLAHSLERAREAERVAGDASLTPTEFRRRYGYAPADAARMYRAALLAAGSERP